MASMYAHKPSDDSSEEDVPSFKRRKLSPTASPAMSSKAKGKSGAQVGGSFASRMMAKMGYVEGQGLGAEGRGRLAPIETQLRPQGAGLGAVKEKTKQAKEEEKREAAFQGRVLEESSEEERKKRKARNKAKQNGQSMKSQTFPGRKKPKVKTIAEIEQESQGLTVPNVLKSIIDATGSEPRLLTSAAGLLSQGTTYVPSETEEVKLARRAQRELMHFSDEWNSLKEREQYYADEGVQLATAINEEDEKVTADASLLALVDNLQSMTVKRLQTAELSTKWDQLIQKLQSLESFALVKEDASWCHEIAVASVYPLFKASISQWSPLEDPIGDSARLDALRLVLGIKVIPDDKTIALHNDIHSKLNQKRSTTHYETMMYTLWLPPVRRAVTQEWDVQDPTSLLRLMEIWKPLLPSFILANVVDQLVVKRLSGALTAWNPTKSRDRNNHAQAPHVWLFPWLQYLDEQHVDPKNSTGLLSDVKRKFKSLLTSWNLNQGLVPGIGNWQSISQSDLTGMLIRYLLPRFRPHLAEFEVDPGDQQLDKLEDVLQWSPFFQLSTMAELVKSEFFPKWHQCLYLWLTSPSVNYDEVGRWYQWWKTEIFEKRLSAEFNELPSIANEWKLGLQSMLEAAELGPEAAALLPPPSDSTVQNGDDSSSQKARTAAPDHIPAPKAAPPSIETPTTFKDVLEEWCTTEGLHLVPLREADVQSGLPLFRITASASLKGGVVVYLKGDIVWVRGAMAADGLGRIFSPMGLDDALIKKAEGK